MFPLQTLSNLLGALREGDYSVRGRAPRPDDALGEVMQRGQRAGRHAARAAPGRAGSDHAAAHGDGEIDVAVFAFDEHAAAAPGESRGRAAAGAARRTAARPQRRASSGWQDCLDGDRANAAGAFPGRRRALGRAPQRFRERGLPHQLLVITDLTQALREEELQAWQRLVRVLGHELNNSLAPIKSIAGSLATLLSRDAAARRLARTTCGAAWTSSPRAREASAASWRLRRLAKLPPPQLQPLDVEPLVRARAASSRRACPSTSSPGRELAHSGRSRPARAGADQSAAQRGGRRARDRRRRVAVGWRQDGTQLEIWVEDEAPGLSSTANLFVPFFTTKPGGSGIGLVLSRQIAEAHGGALTLENRAGGQGCQARLRLPL